MLAVSCRRQQQANSIDQAPPAAWDQLPWPGYGNVNSIVFSVPRRRGKKNRRDALR